MKGIREILCSILFVAFVTMFAGTNALAMADREGVNWRTNDPNTFITSVYQAVLGRTPMPEEVEWARFAPSKQSVFFTLIGSNEYRRQYNFPNEYNIYVTSKWLRTETGGLKRMCNCYYFAEFAYDHVLSGPYSYDVARSLVLMHNAMDREACPYYDCGYSDLGQSDENVVDQPRSNLVLDPFFINFGDSNGPWGRNVLYGEHGIWWNSRNADASAKMHMLSDGSTALYITNRSVSAPHVFGTTAQRIRTEPGRTYRISFLGAARNLASDNALTITVDPKWQVRPVHMRAGSYGFTEFSGTFTAQANYIDLRIIMGHQGEVMLTNMTLTQID